MSKKCAWSASGGRNLPTFPTETPNMIHPLKSRLGTASENPSPKPISIASETPHPSMALYPLRQVDEVP
ncbi:uncharacterized protein PgNI_02902 [Pyricularia grisea]|uniref:Uncharacterized protein n=1 Tax=Pyricularia grisea TaxID=148305 RepID=A0A6P8B9H0_PYRGI|nr:uncharacterized protein PgNI_02902 [Pyricularia grisea]TLD12470.1 hypothetical protein PgNI_02902 [Pyricularia grisea]